MKICSGQLGHISCMALLGRGLARELGVEWEWTQAPEPVVLLSSRARLLEKNQKYTFIYDFAGAQAIDVACESVCKL